MKNSTFSYRNAVCSVSATAVIIICSILSMMPLTAKAQNNITPMVAAGKSHTVTLKSDGTVWAWGDNNYGQLGNNLTLDSSLPVQVKGAGGSGNLTGVNAIAAGNNHTVALKYDGTVWAWGDTNRGQLGEGTIGTSTIKPTPVQVKGAGGTGNLTNVIAIAAGGMHNVALKIDGTVWTWGFNNFGQLGNGTSGTANNKSTPVQVNGVGGSGNLTGIIAIAAGMYHTVALKNDGTVWAWGYNNEGQLGNNSTTSTNTPVQVKVAGGSGLDNVAAIAVGDYFTVALKHDGTVWTWGSNSEGQLGNGYSGTANSKSTAVQVIAAGGSGNLTGVAAISAGSVHTVASKRDGTVWTWGSNSNGQLGDGYSGTENNRSTPVQVKGVGGSGNLKGIIAVSTKDIHNVALKNDGTVWTWGNNSNGQLGNGTSGTPNSKTTPVQVTGSSGTGVFRAAVIVCENVGTGLQYAYVRYALEEATSGVTTIKMLESVMDNVNKSISLDSKNIIFNLNGNSLGLVFTEEAQLELKSTTIDYTGAGSFNIISNVTIEEVHCIIAFDGICSVRATSLDMSGKDGFGIISHSGAKMTFTGEVGGAEGLGCLGGAWGSGSTLTINGNLRSDYAGNHVGVSAWNGGSVTVNGNIKTEDAAAYSGTGAQITVNGNVSSTMDIYCLAASGGKINVTGNVTANNIGVYAEENGTVVTVGGNVTTGGAKIANISKNAKIVFDGNIPSNATVLFGGLSEIALTPANQDAVQSQPGYITYTKGSPPSAVWVKGTPAGAKEITDDSSFIIYPNPTKDELRITNYEGTIKNVEIFDITSKPLLTSPKGRNSSPPSGELEGASINVSSLPQGIYFLKIQTDKGVVTKKFIKE